MMEMAFNPYREEEDRLLTDLFSDSVEESISDRIARVTETARNSHTAATLDRIARSAETTAARARRDLKRSQRMLERLEDLPAEPDPNEYDTLIVVMDVETPHGNQYRYAVLHASGKWWMTGRRVAQLPGMAWSEVLAHILKVGAIVSTRIADTFVEA